MFVWDRDRFKWQRYAYFLLYLCIYTLPVGEFIFNVSDLLSNYYSPFRKRVFIFALQK